MLFVSASSLIFVVVIAIWATYLLFHVTRRREHLATARSVDRFSAHMRVLQRRASRGTSGPAARTSSVTLVRAVTATSPYDRNADAASSPAGRTGAQSSPPPRSEKPASATPRQVAAVGINRGFALLGRVTSVPATTVRRNALLGGVGAMVVTFLGAVLGLLSWLLFGLSLLAVVGVLVWSRATATATRAAFARRGAALRQARGVAHEAAAHAAREARPNAPTLPVAQEHASGVLFADEPDGVDGGYDDDLDLVTVDARRGARGSRDVYDVSLEEGEQGSRSRPFAAGHGVEQGPGTDALDPLGATAGWAPVPVPLPTYALKARADRPMPSPAPVAGPVPIEIEDEFDQWQRDTRGGQAAVNE